MDIPGVGPRLRDRLIEHYHSEDDALKAIFGGEMVDLLNAMSERQAVNISKWVLGLKYGVKPESFLATDEAERISQNLKEQISRQAHTEYARLKIATLFPSSSPELIDHNRETSKTAMEYARLLDGERMDGLLREIGPLVRKSRVKVKDRAVAAGSPEVFQELRSLGLDRTIDVILVDSPQELKDIASGYGHVTFAGGEDWAVDVEQAESFEEWYLVPESVLEYFLENIGTLRAALEAAALVQDAGIREFPGLLELRELIQRLETGEDEETRRMRSILKGLAPSVQEAVEWANDELNAKLKTTSVTLAGTELLQAMGRGDGVKDIFEVQMRGVFRSVMEEAEKRVALGLNLQSSDSVYLEEIFAADVEYPLEVDVRALRTLEHDIRTRLEARLLKDRRALARALAGKRETAESIVAGLMEFDFLYALGRFALTRGLSMPKIVDFPCVGFQDGINLFLEEPEPVSYSLGDTGMVEHNGRVALLSGVNSGGKTSLLDLTAQITILAHIGLPVPARSCKVGIFEELYYFSKSRGTLSAGAFETAMRKFSVVENDRRKMVLADELEAITEPGASARIIGCMLDELNRLGSVAIFVSHLAEEVGRFAETGIRVDGIEAEGLDAENRLVVRRSPRYNFVAKSTPELILDRLVRTTKGREREFYTRILSRFDKSQ